ncbi:MAG: PAS domain S-box protein [Alphaproteobacteria bacterium]
MAVSTDHLSERESTLEDVSEQTLDNILAFAPSPIVILDTSGIILKANALATAFLGETSVTGLIGSDFNRFLAADSRRNFGQSSPTSVPQKALFATARSAHAVFEGNISVRAAAARTGEVRICALSRGSENKSQIAEDSVPVHLEEAIETMSEGFALFDADRRLVMFNENYKTMIWPRLADFIRVGVKFDDIVTETLNRKVWQSTQTEIDELMEQAISRHEDVPSVHQIHYPDGRCIQQSKRRTADGGVVAVYSDITDVIRREAEISETQDRHRILLETLPDGVAIHSGGKFAYVNPALVEMFGGKKHTDLIGRNSSDFVPPEDREKSLIRLEQVLTERVALPPDEQRRIRLDGRIVPVEVRHTFIQWNGKPAVLTVLRDLTERKRAEHTLQETEQRYHTLAANLPGAVYQRVMYPDGTINYPYVSRGVIETHGLEAEAVMQDGSLLVGTVHPDDRERFSRALQNSAQYQTAFDMEVRNLKPNGEMTWIRSLARPRLRDDGAIVWDGIFVDITGRKQAEERAAQTYRWLTEAIDSLSDGFVLWDADDRLLLWNDRFLDSHPQRDQITKTGTTFTELLDHTAKNLRNRMTAEEAEAWKSERLRQHREAEGSYEILTSVGVWLLVTERRTQEGYTVGIYTDICEIKRAAGRLMESEERYRKLVEVSPDAILVHRDGTIVFANDTATEMFGARRAEGLIGTDILDLAADEDRLKILSSRNRAIEQNVPLVNFRLRYRDKYGDIRHCESSASGISWEGQDARLVIIRDIEERMEAERQQALFGAVLDQAADSIEMSDVDFRLAYVNPAFETMFGYTSAEAIGRTPAELLRSSEQEGDLYEVIESTIRSGKPWSGVMNSIRKDGARFKLEATISPVFNESGEITNFVAIKRDITERVETQRALSESEERYRKILALTPDAIYVHAGSEVVLANEAALEVFGASDESEFIGRSIFDLLHPDMIPIAIENQQRVLSEDVETLRLEQKRIRLDGEEFWASVAITPLNWQGERGALVILRDVTDQKEAHNTLVRAMEAAEIANKSKSEFLANMSHELRTPLNAIIGFSEIMQNEMFGKIENEQYTAYAHDIHDSGMHLLHVINDILDLSKIEAGKLSLSKSNISLPETVRLSVRLIRKAAEDANVEMDVRLADDLPVISADERMLKQMLINLLSNAVKFTPSGGKIRISVTHAGVEFVKISIVDSGIGIPADQLPRVLEPFIQVDHPFELRQPGTGLGLPLTKSLAELHGGTFQLWSREGIGTRAVVRLPVSDGLDLS